MVNNTSGSQHRRIYCLKDESQLPGLLLSPTNKAFNGDHAVLTSVSFTGKEGCRRHEGKMDGHLALVLINTM